MKKITIILIITFFSQLVCFGQLEIDAGDNLVLCNFDPYNDSIYLGGNPTVISGEYVKLYWDTEYDIGNSTFYASNFLDDTLSLNPRIIDVPLSGDSLYFFLHAEDSEENLFTDSILILSSTFACLDRMDYYMNAEDTIQIFPTCESFNEPYTYLWSPNYNISSISIGAPYIWPEYDTIYYLTIIDNLGCSYDVEYKIYVTSSSINGAKNLNEIEIYPLPGNEKTLIKFNSYINSEKLIELFNLEGKQVGRLQTNENEIKFSRFNIGGGFYVCKITIDNKLKFSKKIIYAP